ncbi:Hypothetical predicted protein, partial [Scomber scombrus]
MVYATRRVSEMDRNRSTETSQKPSLSGVMPTPAEHRVVDFRRTKPPIQPVIIQGQVINTVQSDKY